MDIAVIVARAVATRIVARGERWRSNTRAQITPPRARSRRATVPARRRGRVTRRAHKKKFASRDVADADPRPRASFARAVPSLSLFLSLSLPVAPPSRLAPRRPDARASRARARRGVVAFARRRGRATDDASAREARSRGGRRPSVDAMASERGETLCAFARRVARSRSSHRVVRTLDCVAPRARGRVVVARRPSRTRTASRHPSRPSPPAVRRPRINQSINRSRVPERRRARSTPRVAARSRCVRVRVRPIHRLDSTRRATPTPARPSERNSNRHPHRRRASLRRPNRAPPPVTHATPRPTERDRSIDRSIDARPSTRDSPSNRTFSLHTRRGGENNPPKNRRDATPPITTRTRRLHLRASRTPPRNTES